MIPLGILAEGERVVVEGIKEQTAHCHRRGKDPLSNAIDMGIRIGKKVEVLHNEGRGPLLLKVDESRIAVDRAMAMRILVRRIKR